jgi:hypothetical protein
MLTADCLLMFLGFDSSSRNVIPAKTFDYLATGSTILALAPHGVTADLIRGHKAGVCLCEPDSDKLVEMLESLYRDWLDNPRPSRKYRYIADIDRKRLTGRLADLLNDMVGRTRDSNVESDALGR